MTGLSVNTRQKLDILYNLFIDIDLDDEEEIKKYRSVDGLTEYVQQKYRQKNGNDTDFKVVLDMSTVKMKKQFRRRMKGKNDEQRMKSVSDICVSLDEIIDEYKGYPDTKFKVLFIDFFGELKKNILTMNPKTGY